VAGVLQQINPQIFNGGQMTDLPLFNGSFDGTELFETVAPGNVENGVNYRIPSLLLAALLSGVTTIPIIIGNGQYNTPGDPYPVPNVGGRIYVNKTIAEPTYILMGAASTYLVEPLIKDIAGTVDDVGNGITVSFTSGQLADGNAVVPITSPYGGYFFRPVSALGKWTLGAS